MNILIAKSKNLNISRTWTRVVLLMAAIWASDVAVAATNSVNAGDLQNTSIGMMFFVVAGIVLLALIFRSSATPVMRAVTTFLGERRIRNVLKKNGRDALHHFILPGAFGGQARIDHALLTKGGIICILTKHCRGTVFGKSADPQWTNVDGPLQQKFLNPMIQNESRCKALSIVAPGVPVRSLVVFTGRINFTSQPDDNIIPVKQLDSYIEKFKFGPCQISDWDAVFLNVKSVAINDNKVE